MKRKVLLLTVSLFSLSAFCQQTMDIETGRVRNGVSNSSPMRDIQFVDDGIVVDYLFHRVNLFPDSIYPESTFLKIEGFGNNSLQGMPAVPFHWDAFVIPANHVALVSVLDSAFVDYNMAISPARPLLWNSGPNIYTNENVLPISSYSGFFPNRLLNSSKIDFYKNKRLLNLCVAPIRFNKALGKTRFFYRIKYKVSFLPILATPYNEYEDVMEEEIPSSFLSNFTHNYVNNWSPTPYYEAHEPLKTYVILTTSVFRPVAERLASWKKLLGFETIITTDSSWNSNSVISEVRRIYASKPVYNQMYLLIIGNNNIVPGTRITRNGYPSYYTDYYYSCVSSFSTDIPCVSIGRLPASNSTDAERMVNKIISYEKNPVRDTSFYKSGLNCAFFDGVVSESEARYCETSECIREHMIHNGFSVERAYNRWRFTQQEYPEYYYQRPTLWHSGDTIPEELLSADFNWDNDSTIQKINKGPFYVLHRDHGSLDGWSAPSFKNANIFQLENQRRLPLVFSVNCSTGNFETDTCFAGNFLSAQNGGCIAMIGAVAPSKTIPNNYLAKSFFNAIWPTDSLFLLASRSTPVYEMGDVLMHGVSTMTKTCFPKLGYGDLYLNDSTDLVYNRDLYNLFGDPSLKISTKTPTTFDSICVQRSEDGIEVTVIDNDIDLSDDDRCPWITFYNRNTGDVKFCWNDEGRYSTRDENVVVCVSMRNKIPYINESDNNLYIQDELIEDSRYYESDTITIGSNVTTAVPSGDVIFNGGEIRIKAGTVEIKGFTEVKKGTNLTITQ